MAQAATRTPFQLFVRGSILIHDSSSVKKSVSGGSRPAAIVEHIGADSLLLTCEKGSCEQHVFDVDTKAVVVTEIATEGASNVLVHTAVLSDAPTLRTTPGAAIKLYGQCTFEGMYLDAGKASFITGQCCKVKTFYAKIGSLATIEDFHASKHISLHPVSTPAPRISLEGHLTTKVMVEYTDPAIMKDTRILLMGAPKDVML